MALSLSVSVHLPVPELNGLDDRIFCKAYTQGFLHMPGRKVGVMTMFALLSKSLVYLTLANNENL